MTGTILNTITVLIGGTLGLFFGARLPERLTQTIVAGLGLFTASIGVSMFLESNNPIVVLGGLLLGGLLGEWWRIEDGLEALGGWLQRRFTRPSTDPAGSPAVDGPSPRERFIRGFLTASLVFCVGPMTILGSIQDGLTGDYELLAIKSTMDGFAAVAFAATMGVGVLFSAIVILGFQGGLSLLAGQLTNLVPPQTLEQVLIPEMSAVGGLLLIGIAISSLLELKKIRVANFLPALVIAPLIAWLVTIYL
ncbi:MAG TPA: DUF554 domain-containing protein [Anaerolineales bacterium]|nr:DUF554 domain-containing protein [Anaerolineales bacterium]